jgi:hypothetical protein
MKDFIQLLLAHVALGFLYLIGYVFYLVATGAFAHTP